MGENRLFQMNNEAGTSLSTLIVRSSSTDDVVVVSRKKTNELARFRRRGSLDEGPTSYSPAFLLHIDRTKELILDQEDTDKNSQVTIEDAGPKYLTLSSAHSHGLTNRSIKGHYMISNLLQELALARGFDEHGTGASGKSHVVIEEKVLRENPIYRLCKMITGLFWPNLKRSIDLKGLKMICKDSKDRQGTNQIPRIYVPKSDLFAIEYYGRIAKELSSGMNNLDVQVLPENIDEVYAQSINEQPGILALQLRVKGKLGLWGDCDCSAPETVPDDLSQVQGVPFIVPGGRFNEMYGWDSYFSALGLLQCVADSEKCQLDNLYLAKSMADNMAYEIRHYGKILNANRSYYLLRTQPPFLTDMTWRIYQGLQKFVNDPRLIEGSEVEGLLLSEAPDEWLFKMTAAAIWEYENVWMSEPRLVKSIGLSRYYGSGHGLPPETEEAHFAAVLLRFAKEYDYHENEDAKTIAEDYNAGRFNCPGLDEYFLHDRAVRESGHDTTYRLDGRCANLLTVDLNSLLYKYETDIFKFLKILKGVDSSEPEIWIERALRRRELMRNYLWNEENGQFYDFDFVKCEAVIYDSATAFWPLWAGSCDQEQADRLISKLLPKLEERGGLVSGSEASRGSLSLERPSRQWDYPYGWAPHQILLWRGLANYGHCDEARRLAYRWLYTILRAYVDYHGVVPEKFNVVTGSHRITSEYGNVGTDFQLIAREGFGWMNTSFMLGLCLLERRELRALGALIEPDRLFCNL